jgi:hypothetical protein
MGQAFLVYSSLLSLPDAQNHLSQHACRPSLSLFGRPLATCLEHCIANHSSAGNPPSTRQTLETRKNSGLPSPLEPAAQLVPHAIQSPRMPVTFHTRSRESFCPGMLA